MRTSDNRLLLALVAGAALLLVAVLVFGVGAIPDATGDERGPSENVGLTDGRGPAAASTPTPVPGGAEARIVADGLDTPWDIAFAPGGRLFLTERPGEVREVVDGALRAESLYSLPALETAEGGALGLAVDPGFPAEPFIYVMYTHDAPDGVRNKIVRLTVGDDTVTEERVLVDEIPGGGFHNGGAVKFGPDGKLYAATGDAGQADLAQDLTSLAGKILRLNPDGSVPDDNPFPGSPVYSYGHRNPQGLAWHPLMGRLYATEHGPEGDDEVNLIEPGGNYGWPEVTGDEHGNYTAPVIVFNPAVAPAGAAFFAGGTLHEWQNSLFFVTLRGQQLHRLQFDDEDPGRVLFAEALYEGEYGRMRAVAQGPDGALYVTTSNRDGRGEPSLHDDRILRIGSAAGRPLLYPDLKTVPPTDLVLKTELIDGEERHVLRFTNVIWNAGEGPLELQEEAVDGVSSVYQNVYDGSGALARRLAGEFVYHEDHDHWHFERMARFELWTRESFASWLTSERTEGEPGWAVSKTSVCMMDNNRRQPLAGSPPNQIYSEDCERSIQGISVGWEDIYQWDLDDQWVDLGPEPLDDGEYVLRSIADDAGTVHESPGGSDPGRDGEVDNEAWVAFVVEDGTITLLDEPLDDAR